MKHKRSLRERIANLIEAHLCLYCGTIILPWQKYGYLVGSERVVSWHVACREKVR